MGISWKTWELWKHEHPEFAEAVQAGKRAQAEQMAHELREGKAYNNGAIFVMSNLHGWSNKSEEKHTISIVEAVRSVEAKATEWKKKAIQVREDDAERQDGPEGRDIVVVQ